MSGLLVGSLVVATRGTLMGLLVGLSMCTLGTGDCGCMEHVICVLLLVLGLGTLGGACTLRTHCVLHCLGLWFPPICWDVPVSEPALHQLYLACPAQLERIWLCLSFLGWL